jgi:hypothetical protein
MFCEACKSVLLSVQAQARDSPAPNEALHGTLEHHTSYDTFREAIEIGCRICKRLQKLKIEYNLVGQKTVNLHIQCRWSIAQTAETRKPVLLSLRHTLADDENNNFHSVALDLVPVEPETGIIAFR